MQTEGWWIVEAASLFVGGVAGSCLRSVTKGSGARTFHSCSQFYRLFCNFDLKTLCGVCWLDRSANFLSVCSNVTLSGPDLESGQEAGGGQPRRGRPCLEKFLSVMQTKRRTFWEVRGGSSGSLDPPPGGSAWLPMDCGIDP